MEHILIEEDVSACYRRKARGVIVGEILQGMTPVSEQILSDLHIDGDIYQVVICEKYNSTTQEARYHLGDILRLANQDHQFYDDVVIEDAEVFLLKGSYAIGKFNALLQQYEKEKVAQKWSPLDDFFIACGRCVYTAEAAAQSYRDACSLLARRFFCDRGEHIISRETFPDFENALAPMGSGLLGSYTAALLNSIQTFSRSGIVAALNRLRETLCRASDPTADIKLFLIDLYLCIREKMSRLYPNTHIPFAGHGELIHFVQTRHYLYEILQYFTEQLESMMSAIAHSSRESVLDDILHYIEHNYADNITLENIAPLFGYNSSYLGRIFSKKMGETFNSYVAHVRIEHSKQMLQQEDAKIYVIAERVGYRNPDYFHIKFKKYVGMSPAEYRKRSRS